MRENLQIGVIPQIILFINRTAEISLHEYDDVQKAIAH